MLLYPEQQPTQPFNSPYPPHTDRNEPVLEATYSLPASGPGSGYAQGLGLHGFSHTAASTCLPSSPQSSEAWGSQFSTAASPMMGRGLADPWSSGAFDYPVCRSPLPWTPSQASSRSSLSYTREMSAFSHEEPEQALSAMKMNGPGWSPGLPYSAEGSLEMHSLDCGREPALASGHECGEYGYGVRYAMPTLDYGAARFDRPASADSAARSGTKAERVRTRRHTDLADALYRCRLCPDKGFARKYNYKQHMLTHDLRRKKEFMCLKAGCGKEFARRTDLLRHDQSVHQRARPFQCARCSSAFSRKDTMRRHEEDGCSLRNMIVD